jgi:crotonobetainyl-CoA:carnitine CoA-transferase CaiB-like acyl-CoA transferase
VLANDYLVEFDHPVLGKTKMVGFPVKFSRTPCAIQREAPELGQHTEEVLQGMGYTQEKIVELKQMRVI